MRLQVKHLESSTCMVIGVANKQAVHALIGKLALQWGGVVHNANLTKNMQVGDERQCCLKKLKVGQIFLGGGQDVGQFGGCVGAFSPQAMMETFVASSESGGVKHCSDLAKQSGVLPLNAAILLQHLADRELEIEAKPFLLCLVFECNVLT